MNLTNYFSLIIMVTECCNLITLLDVVNSSNKCCTNKSEN